MQNWRRLLSFKEANTQRQFLSDIILAMIVSLVVAPVVTGLIEPHFTNGKEPKIQLLLLLIFEWAFYILGWWLLLAAVIRRVRDIKNRPFLLMTLIAMALSVLVQTQILIFLISILPEDSKTEVYKFIQQFPEASSILLFALSLAPGLIWLGSRQSHLISKATV